MASIFRKDDNYVEEPKRNSYDMSFQNNLTLNFGSLRPCLCMPVSPGDSLSIKPTFGLRFLPMKFPVQTRMKASIHYFYVRNRNLWKDFPDFIGRTKQGLVPPYIHLTDQNRKMIETSQLGDFMNIPSQFYGMFYEQYQPEQKGSWLFYDMNNSQYQQYYYGDSVKNGWIEVGDNYSDCIIGIDGENRDDYSYMPVITRIIRDDYIKKLTDINIVYTGGSILSSMLYKIVIFAPSGRCIYVSPEISLYQNNTYSLELSDELKALFTESGHYVVGIETGTNSFYSKNITLDIQLRIGEYKAINVADIPLDQLPWRSDDNENGIPLSALPFRAYESIYNSFYRNAENNPFLIDGVPEYNKWCRTQDGGADRNFYPIMYHNWEDDFLTTAVPSPQQGNAPLVGLQGTPTLTIGHEDGSTTTAQLSVDEDGNVTAVTPLQGDQLTTAALIDAVSYGISINDFRNVNSFQRWLENNIRRGYKYRDQIKTHYGVTVRYDELDMPEFIGGTSEPVLVNQISQTVPTESSPLGDMAGQAGVVGSGQNITHYFDEHGFVIGIVCIKPVANYSQLLPKYFNVTDAFDYYFPEFGHIGMQPITYAEVTPLQAFKEGKLNDVFGYQRAWYDLISKTDEVHGLFRSNLRNFLINRTFDGAPELGAEFTVMDPDQINDVFAYTENTDKILGQIYMDIKKKTPIPLYGVPKLE